MKAYTILVIEDDFLNRRHIKKTLEPHFNIIEASNTNEAYNAIKTQLFDMAIIDINLGEDAEEEGIIIGDTLNNEYGIPFIYLTAYETIDITTKAFHTAPKSYITKPFKETDLLMSVSIAIQQSKTLQTQKTLTVKEEFYYTQIPIESIDYLESDGNYILISSADKTYRYRSSIKEISKILPDSIFTQVHRAFIVNKSSITKYNPKEIIIKNRVIPVSKNYLHT